jgi:hypothetical protein
MLDIVVGGRVLELRVPALVFTLKECPVQFPGKAEFGCWKVALDVCRG